MNLGAIYGAQFEGMDENNRPTRALARSETSTAGECMTHTRTQIFSLILSLLVASMICPFASGQDTQYGPDNEQIPVPGCLTFSDAHDLALDAGFSLCPATTHASWLKDITHWRTERRIRIGYDGARYSMPALQWAQSSFIQPQMMVQDRNLYDPVSGKYTVDRYLDDLQKRYGGIDAV
ncbi:MAG: hypothetical protein WA626_09850, partial [Acidobacteriaceae bacterium]